MNKAFEKILKKLEEVPTEYHHEEYNNAIRDVIKFIKREEEQYNNGWIPCSERMPDVPDGTEDDNCPEFNVTIKGATSTTTLKCAPDGTWFDESGNTYPVSAWHPLPDPYQPKGE